MIIKICGITTREDALGAVEAGANALGFNFYIGSPRFLSVESAAKICEELPPEIRTVGVFVNEPRQSVEQSMATSGLHIAQLHGDEEPQELLEYTIPVWKAFRVTADFEPYQLDLYKATAYVLDGPAGALFGGSGEAFDWRKAKEIRRPVIIAGGLDATNVGTVIRELKPYGVDACSRLELSPGRKDRQRMRDYVQAAMQADAETEKNPLTVW